MAPLVATVPSPKQAAPMRRAAIAVLRLERRGMIDGRTDDRGARRTCMVTLP